MFTEINELLKGIKCASCGKKHSCAIEKVYVEHGAARRFTELCREYDSILIVADENTYRAAGERTVAALSGKNLEKVVFDGSHILIPNEDAIAAVEEKTGGKDLILGIGSGVIQDLCKYVSHDTGIPYMVCATAPSMDGYASSGAAMILKGMKETVSAGVPMAIVADTEVLKNAPSEMIKAGYGDIVGKYSALNDWKLSRTVNGEYFCEYIYDLTLKTVKETLRLADGIAGGDEESVGTLTKALIVAGILMSFAGSSRPASGSEHHLSHFFEITGILDGAEYFPHGINVAYSTVITARLRERILKKHFPQKLYRQPKDEYTSAMTEIYKSIAPRCEALQEKVGNYAADRTSIYLEKESEIRSILAEMPTGEETEKMINAVGLDMSEFFALYGEERIRTAVKYAKDLKDRYTVLWLNYDMFGGACDE